MIFGVSRWFENDFSKFYIEFSLDNSLSNPTIRHFDKNNNFWDYDLFFISGSKYYYLPGEEYKDFVDIFYVYNSGVLEFKFLGQETSPDVPQPPYTPGGFDSIPDFPKFFLEKEPVKNVVNEDLSHILSDNYSSEGPFISNDSIIFQSGDSVRGGWPEFLTVSNIEPAADSLNIFYKNLIKEDIDKFVGFDNPDEISLDNFNEKLNNPEQLFLSEDNGKLFLISDDFSLRVCSSNFLESKGFIVSSIREYYKDIYNSSEYIDGELEHYYSYILDNYLYYDSTDFYLQLYSLQAATVPATNDYKSYTTLNNFVDDVNNQYDEIPAVFKEELSNLDDSYKLTTTYRYYMVVPKGVNKLGFIEKMPGRKGFIKTLGRYTGQTSDLFMLNIFSPFPTYPI